MSSRESQPRLGRGLAALFGDAAQPVVAAQSVRMLALDLLEPGPCQPRSSSDGPALEELAASIRAKGILQPLLVRTHPNAPGKFQIVAGERRWRAASLAGLQEVPALTREFEDSDALAVALIENLQRQDLNALEEAEGYHRLIEEFGLTQEQLAVAVGKSRAHVGNMLRLLNASPKLRDALKSGVISAGHARALLTHPQPDDALAAIIADRLTVRETEALAAGRSDHPEHRPRDPDVIALEREVTAELGLSVKIGGSCSRGSVRIAYETKEQLEELLAKLRV